MKASTLARRILELIEEGGDADMSVAVLDPDGEEIEAWDPEVSIPRFSAYGIQLVTGADVMTLVAGRALAEKVAELTEGDADSVLKEAIEEAR